MDKVAKAGAPITSRLRIWSLTLLFLAIALSAFDRQIMNVLAQDIKVEFGLSDAKLGILTGTAFGLFYLFLAIPFGYLADRMNRMHLISGAVAAWSLFTMGCGVASSYAHLFLARVGVGVGEAGLGPTATSVIVDLFPNKMRTSAMSVMLLGGSIGSILGLLFGGFLGSTWGWRATFIIAGIPGLILAPFMLLKLREPPRLLTGIVSGAATEALPLAQMLAMLLKNSLFMGMVLASACTQFLLYVVSAWVAPFLMRVHNMSTAEAGAFAALSFGLGGALGLMGAGAACDFFRPRIHRVELTFMAAITAISVPALLTVALAPNRTLTLAALFLFGVCSSGALPMTIDIVQRAVGPYARAFAVALNMSVGSFIGMVMGVPLVGLLSDHLAPRYGASAIAYVLACVSLVGVLGVITLLGVAKFWSLRDQRATRPDG